MDDVSRVYYPDLYVPAQNLIIEVKSYWTLWIDREMNILKQAACVAAGYIFVFAIWTDQGTLRWMTTSLRDFKFPKKYI